ncbi:MAG: hypothetical protein ACPGVU_27310, partial [Limisphaerales bacterium]
TSARRWDAEIGRWVIDGGDPKANDANADGGDPNADGGDPTADGGDPKANDANADGGDPNADGGDPNADGGDPNADGGEGDGSEVCRRVAILKETYLNTIGSPAKGRYANNPAWLQQRIDEAKSTTKGKGKGKGKGKKRKAIGEAAGTRKGKKHKSLLDTTEEKLSKIFNEKEKEDILNENQLVRIRSIVNNVVRQVPEKIGRMNEKFSIMELVLEPKKDWIEDWCEDIHLTAMQNYYTAALGVYSTMVPQNE